MNRFTYIRPKTLEDVFQYLGTKWDESCLLAGGTDLITLMRENLISPKTLVNLKSIPELDNISYSVDDGLRIGALTKIAAIAKHPVIKEKYAALAQSAEAVGTTQLRNMGTIGGNLCQRPKCWYYRAGFDCAIVKASGLCNAVGGENHKHAIFGNGPCFAVHPSDPAIALQALNAELTIAGPKETKTVAIHEFFTLPGKSHLRENILNPDEIITEIHVPAVPENSKQLFVKVKEHGDWHTALASLAVVLVPNGASIESARVVLGGVAPTPWTVESAEYTVTGAAITPAIADKAGKAAINGAKALRHNDYKLKLVQNLIKESLIQLSSPSNGQIAV